jgi:hypothetical protein
MATTRYIAAHGYLGLELNFRCKSINMNRRELLIIVLLSYSVSSFGQESFFPSIYPPSPQAASIQSYVESNISIYTGQPNITIPIYSYNRGEFNWNINLNYRSGGIKVEEISSNVGTGWSINNTGMVSRTVLGIPDDVISSGWIDDQEFSIDNANQYYKLQKDPEPDVFHFNVADLSGSFIIDKNGEIIKLDDNNYIIEYIRGDEEGEIPLNGNILKWRIIDNKGYVYEFKDREFIKSTSIGTSYFSSLPDYHYTSSWYLSNIYSPYFNDTITFEYEEYTTTYESFGSETNIHGHPSNPNSVIRHQKETIGKRLTKTQFINGVEIKYMYEQGEAYRCDLIGDKALEEIVVTSNGDNFFSCEFNFDYGFDREFKYCSSSDDNDLDKRLFLNSVIINSDSKNKDIYRFEYYKDRVLPSRNSKAIDHWGYYNGITQNTTLIPEMTSNSIVYDGANRNSSFEHTRAGSIKKINYPTGGSTEYIYEQNECFDLRIPRDQIQKSLHLSGLEPSRSHSIDIIRFDRSYTKFKMKMVDFPNDIDNSCRFIFKLTNADGSIEHFRRTFSIDDIGIENVILFDGTPGQCVLSWEPDNESICQFEEPFTFIVQWQNEIEKKVTSVGGLRLKEIIKDPIVGSKLVKKFYYIMEDSTSSGRISHFPKYDYYFPDWTSCLDANGHVIEECNIFYYYARTSISTIPLTHTKGNVVGYKRVVEMNNDIENGANIYHYTSPEEYSDMTNGGSNGYPLPPLISNEWLRGRLLKKEVYKNHHGELFLLQKSINTYIDRLSIIDTIAGFKISKSIDNYDVTPYYYASGVSQVLSTTRTDIENDTLVNHKSFEYDENLLLLKAKTDYYSNGIMSKSFYRFPHDFNLSLNPELEILSRKNIIKPISIENWNIKNDKNHLLDAVVTKYQKINDSISLPNMVYKIITDKPIEFNNIENFDPDNILRTDIEYIKTKEIEAYDEFNNPILIKSLSERVTLVWDETNLNIIGAVKNALPQDVTYFGFEKGDKINNLHFNEEFVIDDASIIGLRSYRLNTNSQIQRSNLDTEKMYKLSFRSNSFEGITVKNNAGQTISMNNVLQEGSNYILIYDITNTSNVSISANQNEVLIDEVKLFPQESDMTSFSYRFDNKLLVQIEPNYNTLYYKYDLLGRLTRIEDKERNVLKEFHYKTINE